ncbi:hypothetical protein [Arthrobacter sp. ov118]|jgi:hypothetical protein|uniref:hypothetical protein n=1 Tax=Arthrobacter sp. ov118 TaxID=1761747 RepID=UPI0008E2AA47|nr:hypothetical protein [Arthrobacter sp. ov118]SFT37237.1 hypothetical protein SAMN04487915_10181 [Arthrobacter sp. ov118]
MRWDALFNDMEAQLAARQRLDFEAEVAERALVDAAKVELADRLRGSLGLSIRVHVSSGAAFEGALSHAGSEALVLDESMHQVLIPYAAAAQFAGLSRLAVPEPSRVRQRLGLGSALRGLAGSRAPVTIVVARGRAEAEQYGVIDTVGRDFLDLAVMREGEDRRAAGVRQVVTIPFAALAGIRSASPAGN